MSYYRTIVPDRPWAIGGFPAGEYERARGEHKTHRCPYGTMAVSDIAALSVSDLAAPEAVRSSRSPRLGYVGQRILGHGEDGGCVMPQVQLLYLRQEQTGGTR